MRKPLILALILALGAAPQSAEAARVYRCQGRVQPSPCRAAAPESSQPRSQRTSPAKNPGHIFLELSKVPPADRYARVLRSEFSPAARQPASISVADGVWSGTLEGNGLVRLYLEIWRAGQLQERRAMGQVFLKNKATSFKVISALPKLESWNWLITAEAS